MSARLGFGALAVVALLLISPVASAHGANTFSFIMRNTSVQPDDANVQQNDTLIFYNVVSNKSRILQADFDKDGIDDWLCEAGPSDSMSTDDECSLWLDPEQFEPGRLNITIRDNGSEEAWTYVSVTVLSDNHTESGPPDGGFFLPGGGQEPADPSDDNGDTESILLSGAVLAFGAAACIWIMRNIGGGESNNSAQESEEE